jgi:hypothetical protein
MHVLTTALVSGGAGACMHRRPKPHRRAQLTKLGLEGRDLGGRGGLSSWRSGGRERTGTTAAAAARDGALVVVVGDLGGRREGLEACPLLLPFKLRRALGGRP